MDIIKISCTVYRTSLGDDTYFNMKFKKYIHWLFEFEAAKFNQNLALVQLFMSLYKLEIRIYIVFLKP